MSPAGRVVVVGLGPAHAGFVTADALAAIATHEHRFVRTLRHPSVSVLGDAQSFDAVYENATDFASVYQQIADHLVAVAIEQGEVLYAVPGSPFVLERSVRLLRSDPRIEVTVVAGMSFLDLAWARLADHGVDPVEASVRLVDGHEFTLGAAGERGPLLVAHTHARHVLSDIKLAADNPGDTPVIVLQRLGLPDEAVFEVSWADLDRSFEPDHLTCVYVPTMAAPVGQELVRFAELSRTLREQCPWDRAQTHHSLTRHLLEEAYEVVDAIAAVDEEAGEGYEHLEEELGDLLFQVMIHSAIAAEAGQFTVADVARTVHDKLVHRHPHVFGPADADNPGWEAIKAAEKGHRSVMDGITHGLPALAFAGKIQRKAASTGFDWDHLDESLAKLDEELAELREAIASADRNAVEHELGDLLFSAVNVARRTDVDAETAARAAALRFAARFRVVEELAGAQPLASMTGAELEALWQQAKGSAHHG